MPEHRSEHLTQIGAQATANPAAPLSWRTYAEGMPANCARAELRDVRGAAQPGRVLPRGRSRLRARRRAGGQSGRQRVRTRPGRGDAAELWPPHPNLCNDGHDSCGGISRVAEDDATLAAWMSSILALPDYRSGHLLVVITADTSHSPANGNLLATVLVNPDIGAGAQAAGRFDHYSLLRLDEELLGLPLLANAATATDMTAAFNPSYFGPVEVESCRRDGCSWRAPAPPACRGPPSRQA